jgi:hypothetical protein
MIDVVTDLLLMIFAASLAWGRELSRPGSWTRGPWLVVILLGFIMATASAVWGFNPLISAGKPLKWLSHAVILLMFGVAIWRHVREDAAALRARRASP